jgi:hypothetical protein
MKLTRRLSGEKGYKSSKGLLPGCLIEIRKRGLAPFRQTLMHCFRSRGRPAPNKKLDAMPSLVKGLNMASGFICAFSLLAIAGKSRSSGTLIAEAIKTNIS